MMLEAQTDVVIRCARRHELRDRRRAHLAVRSRSCVTSR
jgi:hypothetical protein